jgi:hypothetical protein
MNSRRVAIATISILCTSTLFFFSINLAQENGMICLTTVCTILFLSTDDISWREILLSTSSASLGALSREYGGILLFLGLAIALKRRLPLRQLMLYLGFFFLMTTPWYLRTWIITGNPFYNNNFFGFFPVNQVHHDILWTYNNYYNLFIDFPNRFFFAVKLLLMNAGIPILFGLLLAFCNARKYACFLFAVAMIFAIWIYSVGQTGGGIFYSMRVLSPAIVLLSVCAASIFERFKLFESLGIKPFFIATLVLIVTVFALLKDAIVPYSIKEIAPFSKNFWLVAFGNEINYPEIVFRSGFFRPGSKILTDMPNIHATVQKLRNEGTTNLNQLDVIPVWSPECAFLFDMTLSHKVVATKLRKIGVRYIVTDRSGRNLNYIYLQKYPFFKKYDELTFLIAKVPFAEFRELKANH